ncbi:hypothetical protein [Mycoplasma sp. Ms02]|uniref:hypothetical protein n=1 Tax=Mycoplasma sp. Ms02 TaxID=353851 RepID=UPI001C8AA5B5|nr:hypothetical protein [Mycoplasma sp. Ms02]QZE12700.1 hypothetical protein K4L35_01925 [Mycoplasma sp. Ms02]
MKNLTISFIAILLILFVIILYYILLNTRATYYTKVKTYVDKENLYLCFKDNFYKDNVDIAIKTDSGVEKMNLSGFYEKDGFFYVDTTQKIKNHLVKYEDSIFVLKSTKKMWEEVVSLFIFVNIK